MYSNNLYYIHYIDHINLFENREISEKHRRYSAQHCNYFVKLTFLIPRSLI